MKIDITVTKVAKDDRQVYFVWLGHINEVIEVESAHLSDRIVSSLHGASIAASKHTQVVFADEGTIVRVKRGCVYQAEEISSEQKRKIFKEVEEKMS